MNVTSSKPGIRASELVAAWWRVLSGRSPMLSIEITRECPLSCPGCYAYGQEHLGGERTLRELSDLRGEALVHGVLGLVRRHRPMHVSLVGGEPLVRWRELNRILPALSEMNIFTLVVTSGVIPIPVEWMGIPRLRVAVSVDGLPEHHDLRRKPATYERILRNIEGRQVNIHWVITQPMLSRPGYLEQYVAFWNARSEVNRIWVSLYSPQSGEQSEEMLSSDSRTQVAVQLPSLRRRYSKLLMNQGIGQAFIAPPRRPEECLFSRLSTNYSADLKTRVEPCVFGGTPDCTQCGCAISSGLHWMQTVKIAGPLKIGHFVGTSMGVGLLVDRFRKRSGGPSRWRGGQSQPKSKPGLVQIDI